MSKLKEKEGMKLETYSYQVEKGKIREFAMAIGEMNEKYLNGDAVPPTFGTVIDFWGGGASSSDLLNLNMKKVLHGEQEYEYTGEIRPGDVITVEGILEKAYTKASMNFFIIKKEFYNQHADRVLISRSTVIERH